MLEHLTFFLAFAGYAGLAATVAIASRRVFPWRLWRFVAAIIVAHVALVWAVRYDWQIDAAVRNGYLGFVVFHTALAIIVASLAAADRLARILVLTAFVIVTIGAMGAVFRYEIVAIYRWPVLAIAAATAIAIARSRWVTASRA